MYDGVLPCAVAYVIVAMNSLIENSDGVNASPNGYPLDRYPSFFVV